MGEIHFIKKKIKNHFLSIPRNPASPLWTDASQRHSERSPDSCRAFLKSSVAQTDLPLGRVDFHHVSVRTPILVRCTQLVIRLSTFPHVMF